MAVMRDETRKQYEERVYKGKRSLMAAVGQGEERGEKWRAAWQELWNRYEGVAAELSRPTVDSVTVYNMLQAAERILNRLIGEAGNEPGEAGEFGVGDPTETVAAESTQAQVIAHLQAAGNSLMAAYGIAVEANPLAESLELFRGIKEMSAKIMLLPREVAKLRGL